MLAILFLLVLVVLLTYLVMNDSAFGTNESPSFALEEIVDPELDWIDMTNRSEVRYGDRSTDIEVVDYYSDGKTLRAILWLYHPFQPNQSKLNQETDYGMFVDADFDESTGFGG